MKIVNKYIFRQTLLGFLTILVGLTVLIWLTQSLRMIDMIVTKGVSVWVFLKMTLLVLPNFLQILSPLALFGVALFVFIRMQSDKELIVLKAVGMNARQLTKPLLVLGIILVAFGYFLTLYLIPTSYIQRKEMRWKIQNDLSHLLLQEGQFTSLKNGTTLYIKERENSGNVRGILAYETKENKKSTLIAQEGSMIQTPEGISLTFNKGIRQEYTPTTKQFSILKFDKYTMLFSDKSNKSKHKQDPREMPLKYLLSVTPEMLPDMPLYRKCKVEAFKRLTQPLYNLLFLWLAIFGVLSGFYNRRGQSRQVNAVILATLLLQSFSLAFENIAARNLWGISLMALNLFVPLTILYIVLFKEKKLGPIHLAWFICVLGLTTSVSAAPKIEIKNLDAKAPIDFEADDMSYNIHTNIMTASGNVVLEQNGITMKTEKILYNKTTDQVSVPNTVYMTLPDGTKSTVENMTIFPKSAEVHANTLTGKFTDGSNMSADQLHTTSNGNVIVMNDAAYTPCDICQDSAPLWQISAKKITQDFSDHTLSFNHMFLDIVNVPVLYFPYFQIPDLTVKRKTGLLPPSFRHNKEMGFAVETPIFFNLSDNQNLLLSPIWSIEHRPLALIEYNGRFTKGIINLQLSGTKDNNTENQGHIKTDFRYDVTNSIRLSGQYFRTIHDTYFRRYNIANIDDSESFLQSHLTAEYFGTRLYGKAKTWHFQSLVEGVHSHSLPILIPTVDVQYNSKPLLDNGLFAFSNLNGAMYNTRTHLKSNRLSALQGLELPYTTSFGLVTQNRGFVRLDGYAMDTGNTTLGNKASNENYNKGRFYPVASSKISYPLVARTQQTTQILEPIAMLVITPNTKNSKDILNLDSTIFDFDYTNLFSENRFAGFDRVEHGSRVNYGFQWKAYHNNAQRRSFSFLFGQVFRLHENNELNDVMGYNSHLSDYVGHIRMDYEYLSLSYRFRLDQKNFAKRKNDVGFSIGNSPLRLGINYLYQASYTLDNRDYPEENEIRFSVSSQLTKNWQASGTYRYNLKKHGGPIEYNAQIRYDNECTAVSFTLEKSYARDRNYKGSTSFVVKVFLKTLGGVGE